MAKKDSGKKNLPAKSKGLSPATLPGAMMQDARTSTGFENMSPDDVAIPFIVILQAMSPQVRGKAKIKGCKEGDFFNTVTQENYGDTIDIIPCAYEKAYVEWVPRDKGGGFVNKHGDAGILQQCTRDEDSGRDTLPNGNVIATTAYHYCLLLKDGSYEQVVLGLTSTQLKFSRKWNSQQMALRIDVSGRKICPPMFSHVYTAITVDESNDYGEWKSWTFQSPKIIKKVEYYQEAKNFHDAVTKTGVKTAPPPEEQRYQSNEDIAEAEEEHF